ncbi:FecR family protein [Sunxiuqinia indica]|uniref:FecR family protein n=1 Tax=Sunxiuqinia indica TaxID=2692584 RepID=UPI001357D788|nr:FecR family protein [Sunxiuqinia indica]
MCTTNKSEFPILLVLPNKKDRLEQVIESYRVPETKDEKVVLREIIQKIGEGKNKQAKEKSLQHKFYRIAIPIAASLILVFLLQFFLAEQSFENQTQQVLTFRLPDQSRVVLSPNSTASYPKYWWKRQVDLNGEAYFEVEKGEKFTVQTQLGAVRVLGTRFLVSEKQNNMLVSCYEGNVKFSDNKQEQLIPAGNSLEYKNNQLTGLKELAIDYPELAVFNRTFKNQELSALTENLEQFFNIKIKLQASTGKHFSGKIKTTNAEIAVRIVCRSLGLQYQINSSQEYIINE